MAKILQAYYDFRGGLNTDAAPDNLMDNELTVAENVDLMERGGLVKRKGTQAINAESWGVQVEQLIEWPRHSGEMLLLAVIGNVLARVGEDGSRTNIKQLASTKIGHFFFQDKMYFTDGTEYYVYNGTTVSAVTPDPDEQNDLTPIKKCKFMIRHPKSFRFFAAGNPDDKSALYFSEPNQPGFFRKTSVMFPVSGEGPITGLTVFGDAVMVFFKHSIWIWRGLDPDVDAIWEKIPTGVGTDSNDSIALTTNSLTFLGEGGIYAISPAILSYTITLQPGQDLVTNLAANRVEAITRNIGKPNVASAVFDASNQRYMLAYAEGKDAVRNNKILIYDWNIGAFSTYTGLAINDFLARENGDILAATNGYILRMGVGDSDSGAPIEMRVRSKQYNLNYPFHKKRITRMYMSFRQPEQETSEVTLRLHVDDSLEYEVHEAALFENFKWGEPWGGIWGFRSLVTTRTKVSASGHRIQMEIFNDQLDIPTTVYGIAFEFRPIRAKGSKL